MSTTRNAGATEREQYLQWELEREQEARRALEAAAEDARQRRLAEIRERINYDRRQADDWREAVGKQASLFRREARHEEDDDPQEDHYFSAGAAACDRAIEIWPDVADTYADEIARLQNRLAEIETTIVRTVGEKLAAEDTRSGWRSIASDLITQIMTPSDWLNW